MKKGIGPRSLGSSLLKQTVMNANTKTSSSLELSNKNKKNSSDFTQTSYVSYDEGSTSTTGMLELKNKNGKSSSNYVAVQLDNGAGENEYSLLKNKNEKSTYKRISPKRANRIIRKKGLADFKDKN